MHIVNNKKGLYTPLNIYLLKFRLTQLHSLRALHVWTEKWIFTILLMAEYVAKMRKMRSKCEEMIVNATFAF